MAVSTYKLLRSVKHIEITRFKQIKHFNILLYLGEHYPSYSNSLFHLKYRVKTLDTTKFLFEQKIMKLFHEIIKSNTWKISDSDTSI